MPPKDSAVQMIRLKSGEMVTRDELIRRVTERVYQLWKDEMRLAQERGSRRTSRDSRQ